MKTLLTAILVCIFLFAHSQSNVYNIDSLTCYAKRQDKYLRLGKKQAAKYFKSGNVKYSAEAIGYLILAKEYGVLWANYYSRFKKLAQQLDSIKQKQ